jgi:tetratricopeptide (TPR) repeat protein
MPKALELDPLSPILRFGLGSTYYRMGQYDRSIEQFHRALELNPHFPMAQMFLGLSHIATGKLVEGIRACEMATSLWGRHSMSLGFLGAAYASAGRISEAQKIVEELQGIAEKAYVPGTYFTFIYSGLGEIDKALDWFEKSIEEHDPTIAVQHVSHFFDPLRSHPRYHALLRKMNLEP